MSFDLNALISTIGPLATLVIIVGVGAVTLARAQSRAIEEQTRAQKLINDQFAILNRTITVLQDEVKAERGKREQADRDARARQQADADKIEAQGAALAGLQERFDAQGTELAAVRREKDALGVRIADLERQLKAVVLERDRLASENKSLKDENHHLESRVKALETEQRELSDRLAKQDAKLKALEKPAHEEADHASAE